MLKRRQHLWIITSLVGLPLLVIILVATFERSPNDHAVSSQQPKQPTQLLVPQEKRISEFPASDEAFEQKPEQKRIIPVKELEKGIVSIIVPPLPTQQPTQAPLRAHGTGFIINTRGYVVTNASLLREARQVKVVFYDGAEQTTSIVATDSTLDISILKISEGSSLQVLKLEDSNSVEIGDLITLFRSPLGAASMGVSSISESQIFTFRQYQGERWFELTSSIDQETSGGVLIRSSSGAVVGMISWDISQTDAVTFVRPIKSVQAFLARYLK